VVGTAVGGLQSPASCALLEEGVHATLEVAVHEAWHAAGTGLRRAMCSVVMTSILIVLWC
jgi:hypothetical protein